MLVKQITEHPPERRLFNFIRRNMLPKKLRTGDEIRVIAPARSASDVDERVLAKSVARLTDMGLNVSYSKNAFSNSQRGCPTDDEKISDFYDALNDKNVKCIIAAIGGYNSNQLLDRIDWEVIKNNPKIIAGYSDLTVLLHAIFAKTGLVCYAAPNLYNFGLPPEADYTEEYFKKCLLFDTPKEYDIIKSKIYYDFPWTYDEHSSRKKMRNIGPISLQTGSAEGTILGGNMCSLNLLNGTGYFPSTTGDIVLFIEDDSYDSIPETFERNLQSIIQQPYFKQVKAILIGRFQNDSKSTEKMIREIINSKGIDEDIAIAYNLDFGHTDPKFTYPIGGKMIVNVTEDSVKLKILQH